MFNDYPSVTTRDEWDDLLARWVVLPVHGALSPSEEATRRLAEAAYQDMQVLVAKLRAWKARAELAEAEVRLLNEELAHDMTKD